VHDARRKVHGNSRLLFCFALFGQGKTGYGQPATSNLQPAADK
jgi:hypothetical protein